MNYNKWQENIEINEDDITAGIIKNSLIKPDNINASLYQDSNEAVKLIQYLIPDDFSYAYTSDEIKEKIKLNSGFTNPLVQTFSSYGDLYNSKNALTKKQLYFCKDTQTLYFIDDSYNLTALIPDLYAISNNAQHLKNLIFKSSFSFDFGLEFPDRIPNTPVSFLMFGGGGAGTPYGGGGGGYFLFETINGIEANDIIKINTTVGDSGQPSVCTIGFKTNTKTFIANAGESGKIIYDESKNELYRQAGSGGSGGGGQGRQSGWARHNYTQIQPSRGGDGTLGGGGGGGLYCGLHDTYVAELQKNPSIVISTQGGKSQYAGSGGNGGGGNMITDSFDSTLIDQAKQGLYGGQGGKGGLSGIKGTNEKIITQFGFDFFQQEINNFNQSDNCDGGTGGGESDRFNNNSNYPYKKYAIAKGGSGGGGGICCQGGNGGGYKAAGASNVTYMALGGGGGGGGGYLGKGGNGGNPLKGYYDSEVDYAGGGGGGGGYGSAGGDANLSCGGGGGGYGIMGHGGDVKNSPGLAAGGQGITPSEENPDPKNPGGSGIFIISYYSYI